MIKFTEWNTGRLYAENGQLMIAREIDRRRIAFADLSRGIDGVIHHAGLGAFDGDERELQSRVMTAYDGMIYTHPRDDDESQALRDLQSDYIDMLEADAAIEAEGAAERRAGC